MTATALTSRIGATYTANSNTVFRFSAGRYAQQPPTYQVQYQAKQNNLAYMCSFRLSGSMASRRRATTLP